MGCGYSLAQSHGLRSRCSCDLCKLCIRAGAVPLSLVQFNVRLLHLGKQTLSRDCYEGLSICFLPAAYPVLALVASDVQKSPLTRVIVNVDAMAGQHDQLLVGILHGAAAAQHCRCCEHSISCQLVRGSRLATCTPQSPPKSCTRQGEKQWGCWACESQASWLHLTALPCAAAAGSTAD